MSRSPLSSSSQQTKLALGLLAATLSAVALYYALRSSSSSSERSVVVKSIDDDDGGGGDDDDDDDEGTVWTSNCSAGSDDGDGEGGGAEIKKSGKRRKKKKAASGDDDGGGGAASADKSSSSSSSASPAATTKGASPQVVEVDAAAASARSTEAAAAAELHSKIESIDKRGKALFKSKKYMEAAAAFTEAIDLIEGTRSSSSSGSEPEKGEEGVAASAADDAKSNLGRQAITLLNNRSAMYEKASLPDLALSDCDAVLERDPPHAKARARKLRVLESERRHADALVEVCALQLKFMQDNRDKLRMGLPVQPPVPQSKIEDLMGEILPGEIDRYLEEIKREGRERPLPSDHTIVQLLQSFTGYNAWMSDAARDGSAHNITKELDGLAVAAGDDGSSADRAKRVRLLLKRGRRYAYERSFDRAKDDFEAAYSMTESGGDGLVDALADDDTYPRLLEWTAMSRHLRYDIPGALKLYEKCSELEPTNAELLVKRAGVQMDGGKHDEASELFEAALGLDPDAPDALLHRANLSMLRGKPEDATVDLKRCLELRPDHLLARLRLATVLMATEDLDGAKKSLDLAEDLDPNSSEVHSYRGEMHFAKGEMSEARREFDRAIDCESTNPTPYVNAALAVMNTPTADGRGPPDIPEAVRLLTKAIEVDPQFHAAYVHLGQLKLSMATDLDAAAEVVALYDRGLEYCRTAEELKDIVSMRVLTLAQIDAARSLKMETLHMQ